MTDQETVTLWRPTGPQELALVEASGWTAWPDYAAVRNGDGAAAMAPADVATSKWTSTRSWSVFGAAVVVGGSYLPHVFSPTHGLRSTFRPGSVIILR